MLLTNMNNIKQYVVRTENRLALVTHILSHTLSLAGRFLF